LILKRASKKAIKYSTFNFHYAKRRPGTSNIAYSVFNNKNEWCGCIIYGHGASPSIGKPYGLVHGQIIELVRMALNGKQESTSKALAISMKLVKKDCPTVKMIVSYADKGQNHVGTIYQATNWNYVGQSESTGHEYWYKGRWTHSKTIGDKHRMYGLKIDHLKKRKTSGKIKYIYPLCPEMKILTEKIKKPYPKKIKRL
tara:strand:- start:4937 stop:5533 length:597 start_codon:yes stop_codon:yes gene_type:complete